MSTAERGEEATEALIADPSKLAGELAPSRGLDELRRRARRIFNLAAIGFRQTLDGDKALNWLFLRVLVETNKLYNELSRYARQG